MLGNKRVFSRLYNQRDLDCIAPVTALSYVQPIYGCRGQICHTLFNQDTAHALDLLPPTRSQGHWIGLSRMPYAS